ncbi:hypothetical protein N8292_00525 [Gammaproteobacteria bacterium]|jgi:uncharacterized membrane protein HdeD (DUF308 family)|nr:hypothetical protein [Gammaproteobacteria bacterium]
MMGFFFIILGILCLCYSLGSDEGSKPITITGIALIVLAFVIGFSGANSSTSDVDENCIDRGSGRSSWEQCF